MSEQYIALFKAEEDTKKSRTPLIISEQVEKIRQWEIEHKSNLSNKKWVRNYLDEVTRAESAYTLEGQLVGSTLAGGIYLQLMIELLRKYL